MSRTHIFGLLIVAAAASSAGCGAVKSESSDGEPSDQNKDAGSGASEDGGTLVGYIDGSAPAAVDAGPPNAQCPAHYSVYGNPDASDSLGGQDPSLIASGTCTSMNEQGADGGGGTTDFTMTFTQSSARSGMFMATLHQTLPFPYDLTVCLEADGPGTGSKPTTPGGTDGTMILTNVPEDAVPYAQYPKVTYDTNFQPDRQYGDFLDIQLGDQQGITLGAVKCTFVAN